MDLLASYGSDDDNNGSSTATSSVPSLKINAAPAVATPIQSLPESLALTYGQKELIINLPASALTAAKQGPTHPLRREPVFHNGKLVRVGIVEDLEMEHVAFEEQYNNYQNYGHAQLGDGQVVGDANYAAQARITSATQKKDMRKKRAAPGDPSSIEGYVGSWAPLTSENIMSDFERGTMSDAQKKLREEYIVRYENKRRTIDEDEDFDRMIEKKTSYLLPPRLHSGQEVSDGSSVFHGKAERDYQGRPWTTPPSELKPTDGEQQCYIPKRCLHKWTGHTKGVQAIEFFPDYGHLLLSGSMDSTVKIWQVYDERQCMRTYTGHTAAVRAINFSPDGKKFLSAGFDRYVRLWDTETGQCIKSFTNRRVPYCVKFYPLDDNLFVIGDSNNMIVQFDCTSGEIVQEYNHHLAAVNTVTFVDDCRRIISTSDDKKLLIWEWNIPVPIKYISEPDMHSMPAVAMHPSGSHVACQAMNNQIVIYGARDPFRLNRKKVFKGHLSSGYACQVAFSPNGQFLMSGDGEGKVFFWDWKTTKKYKMLKAHDNGPCIGATWHPIEPSRVATCGWDGLIKYWD